MKTQILVLMFLLPACLQAQDARITVEAFEKEMSANDQEVSLTMVLISKNNNERSRSLNWSSRTDIKGLEASYIYFSAPADIRGTAFLTLENASGQDDQWLYLPALARSRRIASGEKNKSFMGSDFSYEDIGGEKSMECTYKLLRTESGSEGPLQVIEARYDNESKSKESGYSKRILYMDPARHMLVKTEFYGLDGKLIKVLECSDFIYISDAKKWRPKTFRMRDLSRGTQTLLKFEDYKINKGIDPNRFTLRQLESN